MTKANECTCPSGDGSLRHPCPAYPTVEQAGGDERVIGWRERILAAHPNSDPGFWPDALLVEHMAAEIADLRAALAIASSAQTEHERDTLGQAFGECIEAAGITTPGTPLTGPQLLMFAKDLKRDLKRAALAQHSPAPTLRAAIDIANDRFEAPVAKWGTDLAGEEERPEIEEVSEFEREDIARSAFETAMADGISLDSFLSLSNTLAARYERIVGALRFERQQMDRAFTACINERDAANARLHEVATACATAEQERDASLAEVERLRQFERICGGLPQDAIDGGWTVQGIRGYAKRLEDQLKVALDRVAELENQEPVAYVLFRDGEVYYETDDNIVISNTPGDETDLYRWLPVFTAPAAQAQQLHDLDKQCRDDVARALGLRPSQERGFAWSYLLASIKSCVKAAEDTAQAQHSVPDGYALVPLEPTDDMLVAGQEAWTHKMERRGALEDCEEAGDVYRAMLAAAPGKEGV
ncbi:TPA: hypothetical protein N2A84_001493 [Pseudomonas aeruginosa]|nr:hypothetical protein [Pseudomonas aeruginosa]